MKAIVVEKPGGPEALSFQDVSPKEPGAGEVRVRLDYSGVNFIDVYYRTGLYPLPLPFTPGSEGAGVVDAAGADVSDFKSGDRVAFAMAIGSYAESIVLPASRLVRIPESLHSEVAAGIILQGMTAHYLLRSSFRVEKGNTILVHAAAGGVGLLLVQIARHLGATVIGTVSTQEKAAIIQKAGAHHAIIYTQQDWVAEVKRITDGKGCHAVYDSVGQTTFEGSMNVLVPRGYLVLFGQSSGPVPPFNPAMLAQKGSLFLTRPSLAHYTLTPDETQMRASEVFAWMNAGVFQLKIDSTYDLKDAAEAHRRLESRASSGKILLKIKN